MKKILPLFLCLLLFSPARAEDANDPTFLENVAKAAVERVLSRVLDAPVSLSGVRLSREGEYLELQDFAIANPSGFSAKNAISVGTVRVEATPKLLFSKEPQIRLISISKPIINAETGLHGSNLLALMRNAQKASGDRKPKPMAKEMRFQIEKGVLENAEVNFDAPLLQKKGVSKKVDRMEMSFMGANGEGVTAQEGMQQFFQELMRRLGLLDEGSSNGVAGILEGILSR